MRQKKLNPHHHPKNLINAQFNKTKEVSMKNLLIFSLMISITQIHAMAPDAPQDAAHPSPSTDGTTETLNFDVEMCRLAAQIVTSSSNVAQLRVKAIALESVVRSSVPGFAEFELLSKLNFKTDEASQAALSAYSDAMFEKLGLSQEQLKLALENTTALTDITHEETVLRQAVKEIESIIAKHEPTPSWCELL